MRGKVNKILLLLHENTSSGHKLMDKELPRLNGALLPWKSDETPKSA